MTKKTNRTFPTGLILISLLVVTAIATFSITKACQTRQLTENTNRYANSMSGVKSSDLLLVGIPERIPSELVKYEGFILSFNAENHTPNWVAWELTGIKTEGVVSRKNRFWQDPTIYGCPESSDYSHSGYDRGHMIPAADQKWSTTAMSDCFAMTNICPQDHSLNSGAWATLENKERQWAQRDSSIIIIAGPIYTSNDKTYIGASKVRVPSAFFKVIAAPYLSKPRGIAFVYPNMASPGNMRNYSMPIDTLEKITGFDFLYNLPDDVETAIESTADFKTWNKTQ